MITTFLAYFLIACYFIVERTLRKGGQALSLQPGLSDRNSSYAMWANGLFSILLVLLAPILNLSNLGYWNNTYVSWIGIILMMSGLVIRYWAAQTLGKFYTRTLQIVEGHQIIDIGLYSIIRHPGYLGVFVMTIGAGLAVSNWIVLLITTLTSFVSFDYRIRVEEEMLENTFGEDYKAYKEKTKKMISLVY
ncbi:isoprenylcysteine carboxylmethyltransferase family protein [Gloeocapsopsis crepidinum LEGE 06123]|uniref:Isoprenylcysteine carboxylmethyltransferase family protein n=1 Tax=Gloeocapsopsis crepidinum LEGE 06123 TaxID=588587 RepID=A0ABR9USX1_9CHRO|nr:isoprenylcysteine carboxylmethyltransferase family protein [Gloeocapsopsis crepidinum]MBE9190705.1 isoprenylcysteine carboxylmethyltransferase family protein [Gloeocapsopsis crepidinum LEGE 06123]